MAVKKVTAETKVTLLDAYQAVIDEAKADFEAEKAEGLAAWKKDLARQKEEDLYNFGIEKRNREDELKDELARRVSTVAEREGKVEAREVSVGDAEKTIADLTSKVDSIPAIAAKAEAQGFSKGSVEAKKDFDNEVRLIRAENEAEKRISDNEIATLRASNASHEETIKNLREELANANARVQEIATNAVTAAGNSQVTVHTANTK
jgi:hypothetical protein